MKKARAAWLALWGNTVPEAALAGFRVVFWRGYVGGRQNLEPYIIKGARLGLQGFRSSLASVGMASSL